MAKRKKDNEVYVTLPEYALGDWLKDNAGTVVGLGGSVISTLPFPGAKTIGTLAQGVGAIMTDKKRSKEEELLARQEANYKAKTTQMDELSSQITQDAYSNIPVFREGGFLEYSGQDHSGPDGGIPVDAGGNPSVLSNAEPVGLVEDGETVYVTPEGRPYIFSEELGFSKQAKKIVNKYKRRLGENLEKTHDQIARRSLESELTNLINKQEKTKQDMEPTTSSIPQFRRGGYPDIHFDDLLQAIPADSPLQNMSIDELRGKLTEIDGQLYRIRDTRPSDNRFYKHNLHPSQTPKGQLRNQLDITRSDQLEVYKNVSTVFDTPQHSAAYKYGEEELHSGELVNFVKDEMAKLPSIKKGGYLSKYTEGGGIKKADNAFTLPISGQYSVPEDAPIETDDAYELYSGRPGIMPALLTAGANLYGMYDVGQQAKKRTPLRARTVGAQRMDLSPMRQTAHETARTARSSVRRGAARSGMGAEGYSSIGASSAADINRGLSENLAATHVQEQASNIASRERADQFNAQAYMQADHFNRQVGLMDEQNRRRYLDNVLGSFSGYAKDVAMGQQYANIAQMSSDMYDLVSPKRSKTGQILFGQKAPRKRISAYQSGLTKKE